MRAHQKLEVFLRTLRSPALRDLRGQFTPEFILLSSNP